MAKFQITSKDSGADLGTYEGETTRDALDAMARDAGYRSFADACEQSADDGAHLVVTEVEGTMSFAVDTQNDGEDCVIDATDADTALVEVALFRDPTACDAHPGGALGYATERRWTAKLVNA